MFGFDSARGNAGPATTGITAASLGSLRRQQVEVGGTVDSSPIYLSAVSVEGRLRDTFFVTTTYGITEAIDAESGRILWRFKPPGYSGYAGSSQVTTMTPVADPGRAAVYAGAPDGRIRKLSVATGKVLWSTAITLDPRHEKLASALNFAGGLVLAATSGYSGDPPPYDGHVISLNPANGKIVGVFNTLCSNRHGIIRASSCPVSDSAIWGRSAPVVDPRTGNLLVATGNGAFDGVSNWGDSVLDLSPDASKLIVHWTPVNQLSLNSQDLDLGSTAPAILEDDYVVQGGKDGTLRLLNLSRFAGVNATTGGELQTLSVPGSGELLSEPAVWQGTWVFVASCCGTAAWRLAGGRLHPAWSNENGGASPVLAGGLLYVQSTNAIRVYQPSTGRQVGAIPVGETHWQSPIVADGRIAAGEGSFHDHDTSGVLNIYRLP